MIWAHDPPTEPGFFWVRAPNSSYTPRVVEVFSRDASGSLWVACPRAPHDGPLLSWLRIGGLQWSRVPAPSEEPPL